MSDQELLVGGKSYTDPKPEARGIQCWEYVFLKVSPMRGVLRFGKKGKLAPRYVGPFEIIKRWRCGIQTRLATELLATCIPVFHISMLRKYISDPSHVLQPQNMEVGEDLTYEEQMIVDTALKNYSDGQSFVAESFV
ncbi:uncharacterized protein LOC125369241 [Ricinus communis]|uniref:uncharacterized protein LOC125369241 n=1 Tax=Ricinus communis TaxID=3988 RepID=UPI00201AAFB0|nr:uncharacterized protein LOC125369241 [Ricinus communis]